MDFLTTKSNSVHLNPNAQRLVKTERPEGIEDSTNKDTIVNNTLELLDKPLVYEKMSKAINPYGDGKAVERERIVKVLIDEMGDGSDF